MSFARATIRHDYIGVVGRMSDTEGEAVAAGGAPGHRDEHVATAAKPVVLPETFDGTRNWEEWYFHFVNIAAVNGWDDGQKLMWLRVRLTGRAQKALPPPPGSFAHNLRGDVGGSQGYQAEFQTRRRKAGEGWANFADDLRTLADKAYPTLQDEARERLSINAYLQQLTQPQVTFSVKQKSPEMLDDAVAATLEMESYLALPSQVAIASMLQSDDAAVCSVNAIDKVEELTRIVERLAQQVERLQRETPRPGVPTDSSHSDRPRRSELTPAPQRTFSGECWRCHRRSHIARNCPQDRPSQQGN